MPDLPSDPTTDNLLAWWVAQQPLLMGELYDEAFTAGAEAFAEQFPGALTAEEVAGLDANDAFQAEIMGNHFPSVAKMYGSLAALVGTGGGDPELVDEWFDQNAYRIDLMGDSLAWSAEQHGYAVAGADSGMDVYWDSEGDDRVCDDCAALDAGSPYAPDDLPSVPGDGSTECGASCRCSLRYEPTN